MTKYPQWAFNNDPKQILEGMQFSIIYSVDVPRTVYIRRFMPDRKLRKQFTMTEGDEQFEYDYLGGDWKRGKHRKICAVLNYAQFREFIDDLGLYAEDVETMGSIGAPGFGVGWAPAISFSSDDQEAIQSAYVTPIPFAEDESVKPPSNEEESETSWEIIRRIVIDEWGV